MSAALDVDTLARQIQTQYPGIGPELARKKAQQIIGIPTAATVRSVAEVVAMPAIQWPVKLLLPWSHLCSDNVRKMAVAKMVNGRPVAEMLLTSEYRHAKKQIAAVARAALGQPAPEPAHIPLQLVAAVWVPDEIRAHDVPNFQKATLDALEGIVYTKDRWVYDSRFYRAGADVDSPRAEITIRPLSIA